VAALAVIKEFEDGKLLKRANELGEVFAQRAHTWKKSYASIADVRGLGAMRAIEFRNASGEPDAAIAKRMVQECLSRGVIVLLAGVDSNVVRLLMPLVMSVADFKEALDVMEAALAAAAA
jgi:4-aminobutyrate aminotransferase/(S)-3-amino-2-methylpropionate transaminase